MPQCVGVLNDGEEGGNVVAEVRGGRARALMGGIEVWGGEWGSGGALGGGLGNEGSRIRMCGEAAGWQVATRTAAAWGRPSSRPRGG